MAVDVHGSSPPLSGPADSARTSAAFNPPDESVIVVLAGTGYSFGGSTISNNGAALTWTKVVDRFAGASPWGGVTIWVATLPVGRTGMTVTFTSPGGSISHVLKVYVVTGADLANPVGASGSGGATTSGLNIANAYTSTAAGSRGFFLAHDDNAGSAISVPSGFTGTTYRDTDDAPATGAVFYQATPATAAGQQVGFNITGSGSRFWNWGAVEILPGGEDAEVTVEEIPVTVTMPDTAISISGTRTPGPATPTVTMPDTAVSAGSHAHPPSITTTVTMPAVTTVTGTTETAVPATAEPTVDMPDVAATVAVSTIPAAAEPTVDMPDVDLSVSAHIHLGSIDVTVSMPRPFVSVPVLPGDQVTQAGQIEWNGFLLGSGTPYGWLELQGYNDSPPWISGNVDKPDSSGSYPGQPYAGERVINWSMLTKAPRDQIGQIVRDLIMATGLSQTEDELPLVIWDFDAAEPRLLYAHLSNRAPGPVDRQARLGLMRGALQWTASDPRLYSVIRHSATIDIDTERDLLNDGNEATPVELRIPGPATVPQIENMTLDRVFAFNVEIADGETLVIDTQHGTAAIGASNQANTLIEGSVSIQDWVLGPGTNRLAWTAESGGTVMEALWRHAHT